MNIINKIMLMGTVKLDIMYRVELFIYFYQLNKLFDSFGMDHLLKCFILVVVGVFVRCLKNFEFNKTRF